MTLVASGQHHQHDLPEYFLGSLVSQTMEERPLDHLEQAITNLESMPERRHIPPELKRSNVYEYREIHLKVYRIIYQISGSNVFVHCVLDGRRDIEDLLRERLLRRPWLS